MSIQEEIQSQLKVLQEVAEIYGGKTIDNIIWQLQMRLKELQKHE